MLIVVNIHGTEHEVGWKATDIDVVVLFGVRDDNVLDHEWFLTLAVGLFVDCHIKLLLPEPVLATIGASLPDFEALELPIFELHHWLKDVAAA